MNEFKPPDRFNFEVKDGNIYKPDYTAQRLKELEEFEKKFISKTELHKWLLGIVAGNFLLIGGAVWSISSWKTNIENKVNDLEEGNKNVIELVTKENEKADLFRQEIRDRVKTLEVKYEK